MKLKEVKEYPGIFVDKETAKIYTKDKGVPKELKFYLDPRGFYVRNLPWLGIFVRRSRIIGLALVKKPAGACRIRHRNGDIADDSPENIYWAVPISAEEHRKQSRERMREKLKTKAFLMFNDGKQHWCDKDKVAHLLDLKPRARGSWKPEYLTK